MQFWNSWEKNWTISFTGTWTIITAGTGMRLSFSVTDTGGGTCTYDARLYFRCQEAELEVTAARTGASGTARCTLHVRNLFEAVLTARTTRQESRDSLDVTPPDGALDLLELDEYDTLYT